MISMEILKLYQKCALKRPFTIMEEGAEEIMDTATALIQMLKANSNTDPELILCVMTYLETEEQQQKMLRELQEYPHMTREEILLAMLDHAGELDN